MTNLTPHLVYGTVSNAAGTALTGVVVTAHDRTTGGKTAVGVDSTGQYLLDLANISPDYSNGDAITIFVRFGGYTGESSFTLDISTGSNAVDITAYAGVTDATIRTSLWDGMYQTLQNGVFAISTNNIHQSMNDKLIESEGYPQVTIYTPEVEGTPISMSKKKLKKKVTFRIDVYHTSAESMKSLADEVENKIWTATDVWKGLFLFDPVLEASDYDWWTDDKSKIHYTTFIFSFGYSGTVA